MEISAPKEVLTFLNTLREQIIAAFEDLEDNHTFNRKKWDYHTKGGGEIGLIRGDVFEKAAVNWSGVGGHHLPMQEQSGPFFATGVSLITHMTNPYAPTAHMNVRYIATKDKAWFGGGYDLTPMGFPFEEDTKHFHQTAKCALDAIEIDLYEKFSANAREYFYIPHWKKERGVGGVFFDNFNSGNFEKDFAICQAVGESFLDAIMPIYKRRINLPYSDQEKIKQLEMRAHYVEFNLLYDRGTKFGFASNGNPEGILCSMPPLAKW